MLATTTDVLELTNRNLSQSLINRAQAIVEMYVGKFEDEITNEKDLELIKRAVSYQAAYMDENEDIVFEQIAASTISQNDASTTFKAGDQVSPWIAPLTVMSCKKLSFNSSRSIATGKIRPNSTAQFDGYYYEWVIN
jgi:hypothetical protein